MISFKEKINHRLDLMRCELIDHILDHMRRNGYENYYLCGYKPDWNDGDECEFSIRYCGDFNNDEDPDTVDFYERHDTELYQEINIPALEHIMFKPVLIIRKSSGHEWRDYDHE